MADWGAMVQQLSAPRGNERPLRSASALTEGCVADKLRENRCPFIFYGQLTPTHVPEKLMFELEQESFEPTGISTVDPPKMALSGVFISKSCGILYHIDDSAGVTYVTLLRQHHPFADDILAHGVTIARSSPVRRHLSRYNGFPPE